MSDEEREFQPRTSPRKSSKAAASSATASKAKTSTSKRRRVESPAVSEALNIGSERIRTPKVKHSAKVQYNYPTLAFRNFGDASLCRRVSLDYKCFVFYGFVVAGEEIENPFGYDKNDLRIDHFVRNIIQKELHAITATPTPNPKIWAFSNENNFLQDEKYSKDSPDKILAAWLEKGEKKIHHALHRRLLAEKLSVILMGASTKSWSHLYIEIDAVGETAIL
ncbi:hypothetical protein DEU56DRAFT_762108 [Suillus clintonianus]|uniref:uncharacterized protein n=1 Tax=Suillus clintonianus TaxID=1904413 RepID=UPI001B86CE77|nr:uncharacterized protein DEU56DRAFT_762108 [Suillus clintonianus]KAG2111824.1 hypothetical protein DEU56DRAFT_762108 [Suillus clintonianus]